MIMRNDLVETSIINLSHFNFKHPFDMVTQNALPRTKSINQQDCQSSSPSFSSTLTPIITWRKLMWDKDKISNDKITSTQTSSHDSSLTSINNLTENYYSSQENEEEEEIIVPTSDEHSYSSEKVALTLNGDIFKLVCLQVEQKSNYHQPIINNTFYQDDSNDNYHNLVNEQPKLQPQQQQHECLKYPQHDITSISKLVHYQSQQQHQQQDSCIPFSIFTSCSSESESSSSSSTSLTSLSTPKEEQQLVVPSVNPFEYLSSRISIFSSSYENNEGRDTQNHYQDYDDIEEDDEILNAFDVFIKSTHEQSTDCHHDIESNENNSTLNNNDIKINSSISTRQLLFNENWTKSIWSPSLETIPDGNIFIEEEIEENGAMNNDLLTISNSETWSDCFDICRESCTDDDDMTHIVLSDVDEDEEDNNGDEPLTVEEDEEEEEELEVEEDNDDDGDDDEIPLWYYDDDEDMKMKMANLNFMRMARHQNVNGRPENGLVNNPFSEPTDYRYDDSVIDINIPEYQGNRLPPPLPPSLSSFKSQVFDDHDGNNNEYYAAFDSVGPPGFENDMNCLNHNNHIFKNEEVVQEQEDDIYSDTNNMKWLPLNIDLSWLDDDGDDEQFERKMMDQIVGQCIQIFSMERNGWRYGKVCSQLSDGRHVISYVDGNFESVDLTSGLWRRIS